MARCDSWRGIFGLSLRDLNSLLPQIGVLHVRTDTASAEVLTSSKSTCNVKKATINGEVGFAFQKDLNKNKLCQCSVAVAHAIPHTVLCFYFYSLKKKTDRSRQSCKCGLEAEQGWASAHLLHGRSLWGGYPPFYNSPFTHSLRLR